MAICAALTFSCCSSDDDDDNGSYNGQPLTTWSDLVSEDGNDWLKDFPEVPVILSGIYATLCNEHAKTIKSIEN